MRLSGCALLASCLLVAPLAAVSVAPAIDLDAPLPFDERVSKETLDNGLTVLVRENARPEARADLRLVVKAGSVDEDEDQRGFAHFLEHMLFNGTESYEGNEIVSYLESIGARFGADLNAYTSFDETVYMLHIPTDRPELLETGVRILAEFAAAATLEEEEIEKERGVVLDEWRRGRGASARVRDRQLPIVLHGSRYAERLPIGLPEIIETGDPEAIRRYYRDWYRPERMAVVAVGDFDGDRVRELVREAFGAIPSADDLRERGEWDVPATSDTLFALADDPELRGTSVGVSRKFPAPEEDGTYGAYRRDLVRRVTSRMFNERLVEVSRSEEPPFLAAGLGATTFGGTELVSLSARVQSGQEAVGLAAILTEASRASTHGFLESELERARRGMIAGIEAAYAEREKTPSSAYVSEYTRHFLRDEPVPGIEVEVDVWRELLPGITAEECHEIFRELSEGKGLVVEATRPTAAEMVGEAELREVVHAAGQYRPEPYVDLTVAGVLWTAPGPPGEIVERRELTEIGVTEATLSNGVRVFLKPTEFQDDDIRFTGISLGGTSQVEDPDVASAGYATSIAQESGWGGHSPIDLGKLLTGKVVSVRPSISGRRQTVGGSSTVADFPTALEVTALIMGPPNRDPEAFARFRDRLRASLANRAADPQAKYSDRVTAINTSNHPRHRPMTLERVDEIDFEKAMDFYERCFENPSSFAFFFVGNLDVEAALSEIARTLGSLPVPGREPTEWVDREIPFPDETIVETVYAGTEPKGRTALTFASYDGNDPREWHRLRTATSILSRRLREVLREDLGATYGVGVQFDHSMIGPARGRIRVGFGSDPAQADSLVTVVFEEIAKLREDGPTDEEIATEKELQTRDLETALETNGFWMGSLGSLWMRDRDLLEIRNRQIRIDELERERVHRVFRDHFPEEPYTCVSWAPEEKDPDPAGTE